MPLPVNPLFEEGMRQAANRSALTAAPGEPAFAELIAFHTIRDEDMEKFSKTNLVDIGELRYIKDAIYNVQSKKPAEIEDTVNRRIADLERINDAELHEYKFRPGTMGELVMIIVLKRKIDAR